MTRSDMREHTFKILFRVPFHNKNELREQIDYYFDAYYIHQEPQPPVT
jgi:transcription antitermination protein NusB